MKHRDAAALTLQVEALQKKVRALTLQNQGLKGLQGDYSIIEPTDLIFEHKIEEDPFGDLYQARWKGQAVIVKQRPGPFDELEQAQFRREVAIVESLKHPNIVTFYGAYLRADKAYIVMEYMSQGNLRTLLSTKVFSLALKQALILDIVRGLEYLHKRQMLHRDLRSSHILVSETGVAKLAHFGLSKTQTKRVKTTLQLSPNLAWQAPECFESLEYTMASDIYSFGMVMWEIMTGQVPREAIFERLAVYKTCVEREIITSKIPLIIADLIRGCWALDPIQRPSVQQIIQCLHSLRIEHTTTTALIETEHWYNQGLCYEQKKCFVQAFECYKRSATNGYPKAKTNLGIFYMLGSERHVKENKSEAHLLFLEAAQLGHDRAMYNVARSYEKGDR